MLDEARVACHDVVEAQASGQMAHVGEPMARQHAGGYVAAQAALADEAHGQRGIQLA